MVRVKLECLSPLLSAGIRFCAGSVTMADWTCFTESASAVEVLTGAACTVCSLA